jgi:hypothetical protein
MSLENATTISELVPTNPTGSDPKSQGDDHLRMIKLVLQNDAVAKTGSQSMEGPITVSTAQSSDPASLTRKDYVDGLAAVPAGSFPVGGTAALNATWTKLPIYSGYAYGMTFETDSVRIDKAGTYLITANMATSATSDAQMVSVWRNGTPIKEVQNSTAGFNNSMSLSFMIYLAVNDVIDLRGIRGGTPCDYVGGKTSLEIAFIRP